MSIELATRMLLWSLVINICLLFLVSMSMIFFHDFIYRIQSRFFRIPVEKFDSIMYAMIIFYKILIVVFNAVPFFVLLILTMPFF